MLRNRQEVAMGKRRLQELLDRAGLTLSRLCDDLGLAKSTASRWTDDVPRYARLYAAAMAVMTPEQREEVRKLADG
jgi:transcriptional regulator with XRE-family HTH domain